MKPLRGTAKPVETPDNNLLYPPGPHIGEEPFKSWPLQRGPGELVPIPREFGPLARGPFFEVVFLRLRVLARTADADVNCGLRGFLPQVLSSWMSSYEYTPTSPRNRTGRNRQKVVVSGHFRHPRRLLAESTPK